MTLPRSALLATLAGGLLLACTTDDPAEHFWTGASAAGSAGSGPLLGGSGGSKISGSGGTAGSEAGTGAAGGSAGASAGSGGASGSTGPSFAPHDCGSPPLSESAFSLEALRGAAADCAVWHYACFEGSASVLSEYVGDYVEEQTPERLELARAAWRDAMARWSAVELFQFGPLASPIPAAGKDDEQGQSLREPIYSWPSVARCRVEELVLNRSGDVYMSGRGMFALEYLLFYQGSDTVCLGPTAATWAALGAQQLTEKKLDYALWLAGDIQTRAQGLGERWSPNGGNFTEQFVSASGYSSVQKAMTVLAWALIYIERETKDWKLGVPAGYTIGAPVSSPEAPFAGVATENLRANLRGFRSLFQGCGPNGEGLGFDDWLFESGNADLATRMVEAWEGARTSADALPALQLASPQQIDAAYQALRVLTTLMKTELLVALNLELPTVVGDDTD